MGSSGETLESAPGKPEVCMERGKVGVFTDTKEAEIYVRENVHCTEKNDGLYDVNMMEWFLRFSFAFSFSFWQQ